MAMDFFGLQVGDIAATAALIASALTFSFGYAKTRKSEQLKISRDIVDSLFAKTNKTFELFNKEAPSASANALNDQNLRSLNIINTLNSDVLCTRYA